MRRQKKYSLHRLLIILLGLILSIGWIYPFFIIFIGSLKTRSEIFTDPISLPDNPVWGNYATAWENMDYGTSFMNSLIITVVSVFLIVIFSAMAAYALSRVSSRISRLIYLSCAVLMLVPFQTLMIPLVTLFGQIDLINRVGLIILNAIRIWNDYLLPSLVINQDGMRTIPLQMYAFFGEYTVQWELALAALVLSIIPIIILYIFLQRYIVQGVTDGAVKAS